MKVNILGTEYEIIVDAADEMLPEDSDGCMDHSLKRIFVAKFEADRNSIKDLDCYRRKVLRMKLYTLFYMNLVYGIIAEPQKHGQQAKK